MYVSHALHMLKYFSNYLQVYLSTSIYVFIRNMKISLNITCRNHQICRKLFTCTKAHNLAQKSVGKKPGSRANRAVCFSQQHFRLRIL